MDKILLNRILIIKSGLEEAKKDLPTDYYNGANDTIEFILKQVKFTSTQCKEAKK